jgi:hypothetical protein
MNDRGCWCHVVEGPLGDEGSLSYSVMGLELVINEQPIDYCVDGSTLVLRAPNSDGGQSYYVFDRE